MTLSQSRPLESKTAERSRICVCSDCQWSRHLSNDFNDYIPFRGGNFVGKIHGNGFALFRFLTPFPHRPSRHLRNSAHKTCHLIPDVRVKSFFNNSILPCSNILGGWFHRLPSRDGSGRLNLQGRSFHSRVFHLHNMEENHFNKIKQIIIFPFVWKNPVEELFTCLWLTIWIISDISD